MRPANEILPDVIGDLPPPESATLMQSMQASAEAAAELLRAIGSAYRIQILCLLAEGPRTVTEICDATGMRQSLASQHLSRLRLDGLVKPDRQGHYVYYTLSHSAAKEIIAILYRHFCAPQAAPGKD